MSKEEKIEALENLINRFWYINNYDLNSEDHSIVEDVEKVKEHIKALEE
jgi:hypothetical protein